MGFFVAFGAAALALLALVAWHVFEAALSIATPFVFGTMLTLLLDPLVDRIQRRGYSRIAAVGIVFIAFLIVLVLIGIVAIPALVNQTSTIAEEGPRYLLSLQTSANQFLAAHPKILGFTLPTNVSAISGEISNRAANLLSQYAGRITEFLLGSISTLLEMILTLIVTFYLLVDIDKLRARLFYLAPEKARRPMALYARDIGRVFSEYLRGLLIVSLLYGAATFLLLMGMSLAHHDIVRYALLAGVAGGLLYTIPYLGPFVTAFITFLVAFAAGGIGFGGLGIVLTLVLNQIFDNIITPRIVGGGVGLHPVVSLFALTLGGALFGLWGLLLSVPIAASIQAILFRLFPKLTTPTPPVFLEAENVPPDEAQSETILEGIQKT